MFDTGTVATRGRWLYQETLRESGPLGEISVAQENQVKTFPTCARERPSVQSTLSVFKLKLVLIGVWVCLPVFQHRNTLTHTARRLLSTTDWWPLLVHEI